MTRAYKVVDADGHILEPLDLWDKCMDPEFRERRPRFVIDENGKERLSVEGKLLGNPRGIGSLGSVGVRQGIVKAGTLKYAEGRRAGVPDQPCPGPRLHRLFHRAHRLGGRQAPLGDQAGDGALGHIDTQLQELAVDSGGTPQGIRLSHS
jgi:hypothetical protein